MKLVSLNYRIATKYILKATVNRQAQDRACIFCRERNKTIYHIVFRMPETTRHKRGSIKLCGSNKGK